MIRREDWPERFRSVLEERRAQPFDWGTHDCALFACDVVKAMTGIDPAVDFRGRYRTRRGARRALIRFSGLPAPQALAGTWGKIAATHGWAEIPPNFAQRGDVVLFSIGPEDALGVCAGGQFIAPTMKGLLFLPLASARRAWRI